MYLQMWMATGSGSGLFTNSWLVDACVVVLALAGIALLAIGARTVMRFTAKDIMSDIVHGKIHLSKPAAEKMESRSPR